MSVDEAILGLREDLKEIAAVDGCAACECLMAIAAQALVDVRRIPGEEARSAEQDLRDILDGGSASSAPCAGCEPCLPVEPYLRFRRVVSERAEETPQLGGCDGCGCDGCGQ